ncbi:MAG TPA: BON domain-containing protein [Roseiflexaceae bacterium]|nr:BON domain-containing protein [Roseiflexaceae bacterium]
MTDRERNGRREMSEDWAEQVPRRNQPRGPYEDYGWERGESALPEFRDPSVHDMPYEQRGRRDADRYDRLSGARAAEQRRSSMHNPYDEYDMYQRAGSPRSDYGRDYGRDEDYYRWGSGGRYGRARDQERWRGGDQGRDIDYERWYSSNRGNDEFSEHDQDRWRYSAQQYGGPYRHDYDQDPRRAGSQGYTTFSRDYDQDRWRSDRQGYGGSFDVPSRMGYAETWQIPGPFTGRGPRGYQRSDERIKEDISDRLTMHGRIDASDIEIQVANCEVTLAGTVDNRAAKRMAEDVAESVQGVSEVHNQLRVRQNQQASQTHDAPHTQLEMRSPQPAQGQGGNQERAMGSGESGKS